MIRWMVIGRKYAPSGVNSPHTTDDTWPANTCIVFPEGTTEVGQDLSAGSVKVRTYGSIATRWYRWTQQVVRFLLGAISATVNFVSQRKGSSVKF